MSDLGNGVWGGSDLSVGYAWRLAGVVALSVAASLGAVVWAGLVEPSDTALAALVAAGAVPVGVTFWLGRRTAADLTRLETAARGVAVGNGDVTVAVDRGDEVGAVGDAMVAVRDALDSRTAAAKRPAQRQAVVAEYCEAMRRAGRGDLSVRLDATRASGDLQAVARAFNDTVAAWARVADELEDRGDAVAAGADSVHEAVGDLHEAAERVATETRQARETARDRRERHRQVAEDVTAVSQVADRLADAAGDLQTTAERPVEAARVTEECAAVTVERLGRATEATATARKELDHLGATVADVERLSGRLEQLATAVNRAALNASIAATEGGERESTSDFKAVVDEMQSAVEAAERISVELRSQTATTATAVREVETAVESGRDAVERTATAAQHTRTAVDDLVTDVGHLKTAATHQAEDTDRLARLADNAVAAGADTTGATERAAAVASETVETAELLREWSGALDERTADLAVALGTVGATSDAGGEVDTTGDQAAPVADGGVPTENGAD